MIDLNNEKQIKQIKKDASDPGGKRLLDFFQSDLPSFEDIDEKATDEETGREFKRIKGIRKFIKAKIKILTS